MKKRKLFIGLILAALLLLIASIVFSLLQSNDSYRYFTGMGNAFDISPNDNYFLFSYYLDGKENIYRANADGTDIEKLTDSTSERLHSPKYSVDGNKILYLAKNAERINALCLANQNGREQKILTTENMHVQEAAFSITGEEIYFIGTPAESFKEAEGETTDGYDLFVVEIDSGNTKQLTYQDYFAMSDLIVSQSGKEIYYNNGSGSRMTAYSLEDDQEQGVSKQIRLPYDSYSYSTDGSRIAYTRVSEESRDSSLFEYELFLFDPEKGQSKRLTDLNSSVVSPRFFKEQNNIAFLENTNWPKDPKEHALKVMDLETEQIHSIDLTLPHRESSHWLLKIIGIFANGYTVAILYVALLGLLSTYLSIFHSKRKRYIPVIVSLLLAVLVLISSFVVAFAINPWYGIGLGVLAAALLGCTLIAFGYAFALKYILKTN